MTSQQGITSIRSPSSPSLPFLHSGASAKTNGMSDPSAHQALPMALPTRATMATMDRRLLRMTPRVRPVTGHRRHLRRPPPPARQRGNADGITQSRIAHVMPAESRKVRATEIQARRGATTARPKTSTAQPLRGVGHLIRQASHEAIQIIPPGSAGSEEAALEPQKSPTPLCRHRIACSTRSSGETPNTSA